MNTNAPQYPSEQMFSNLVASPEQSDAGIYYLPHLSSNHEQKLSKIVYMQY